MSKLSQSEHAQVMKLGIDFQRGDDCSKNAFIRDELALVFKKHLLEMLLESHEVGVHPVNRNNDEITHASVWMRGSTVFASGFSFVAMGMLYAFEDNPMTRHIAKHTVAVTSGAEFGDFEEQRVKVGPANWTHCNQFSLMVIQRKSCSHPGIPTIDGRIDTDKIFNEEKNRRFAEYASQGMTWLVFPWWVEDVYPWTPDCFQTTANQEQQVQ